jgi:hypothetical protein
LHHLPEVISLNTAEPFEEYMKGLKKLRGDNELIVQHRNYAGKHWRGAARVVKSGITSGIDEIIHAQSRNIRYSTYADP